MSSTDDNELMQAFLKSIDRVERIKQAGNQFFSKGSFDKAIHKYEECTREAEQISRHYRKSLQYDFPFDKMATYYRYLISKFVCNILIFLLSG